MKMTSTNGALNMNKIAAIFCGMLVVLIGMPPSSNAEPGGPPKPTWAGAANSMVDFLGNAASTYLEARQRANYERLLIHCRDHYAKEKLCPPECELKPTKRTLGREHHRECLPPGTMTDLDLKKQNEEEKKQRKLQSMQMKRK